MPASPHYQWICVEHFVKNAVFAKCLQVFKMFGRVGGLKYLCIDKPGRTALKSFSMPLTKSPPLSGFSSPLKQLL